MSRTQQSPSKKQQEQRAELSVSMMLNRLEKKLEQFPTRDNEQEAIEQIKRQQVPQEIKMLHKSKCEQMDELMRKTKENIEDFEASLSQTRRNRRDPYGSSLQGSTTQILDQLMAVHQ